MNRIIHIISLLIFTSFGFANSLGYLKQVEASFCMDDCSQYMLEEEDGSFVTFLANTNELDLD